MTVRLLTKPASRTRKITTPLWQGLRRSLRIGLVNNMPDAAIAASERQFAELLRRASHATGRSALPFHIERLHLPALPRGVPAREAMRYRYRNAADIAHLQLDGIIFTGGVPNQADLRDEPYWRELTDAMNAAAALRLPTLYSCMAAHAAVLHFDQIRRRPLPQKLSGVYRVEARTRDGLLARIEAPLLTPHSRYNGLDIHDLESGGYKVLTGSAEVGADAFINRTHGLTLFTHGHPEYEIDTLMLEYRRDLRRFLNHQRPDLPPYPANYFDPATRKGLDTLNKAALANPRPELLADFELVLQSAAPAPRWSGFATALYAGWLREVADYASQSHPLAATPGPIKRLA
ncbi:MAG: homoserine O-succinyltransferase [Hyphomicrobiales bacterium]|nr:homoserine O-succinyltransferase [Hyphomicrobiales bacterium]MDE2114729.1 homoserine O-succinyltransferase [Hyphomicrobiales bacterium]